MTRAVGTGSPAEGSPWEAGHDRSSGTRGGPSGAEAFGRALGAAAASASSRPSSSDAGSSVMAALGDRARRDPGGLGAVIEAAFGDRAGGGRGAALVARLASGAVAGPGVRLAGGDLLPAGARGAYAAGAAPGGGGDAQGTVWLDRGLGGDPAAAGRVLVEEVGHHLDAALGAGDAAGDEGAVFAALVLGEQPSPGALAALRAEDDRGRLADGTRVEFYVPEGATSDAGGGTSSGASGSGDGYSPGDTPGERDGTARGGTRAGGGSDGTPPEAAHGYDDGPTEALEAAGRHASDAGEGDRSSRRGSGTAPFGGDGHGPSDTPGERDGGRLRGGTGAAGGGPSHGYDEGPSEALELIERARGSGAGLAEVLGGDHGAGFEGHVMSQAFEAWEDDPEGAAHVAAAARAVAGDGRASRQLAGGLAGAAARGDVGGEAATAYMRRAVELDAGAAVAAFEGAGERLGATLAEAGPVARIGALSALAGGGLEGADRAAAVEGALSALDGGALDGWSRVEGNAELEAVQRRGLAEALVAGHAPGLEGAEREAAVDRAEGALRSRAMGEVLEDWDGLDAGGRGAALRAVALGRDPVAAVVRASWDGGSLHGYDEGPLEALELIERARGSGAGLAEVLGGDHGAGLERHAARVAFEEWEDDPEGAARAEEAGRAVAGELARALGGAAARGEVGGERARAFLDRAIGLDADEAAEAFTNRGGAFGSALAGQDVGARAAGLDALADGVLGGGDRRGAVTAFLREAEPGDVDGRARTPERRGREDRARRNLARAMVRTHLPEARGAERRAAVDELDAALAGPEAQRRMAGLSGLSWQDQVDAVQTMTTQAAATAAAGPSEAATVGTVMLDADVVEGLDATTIPAVAPTDDAPRLPGWLARGGRLLTPPGAFVEGLGIGPAGPTTGPTTVPIGPGLRVTTDHVTAPSVEALRDEGWTRLDGVEASVGFDGSVAIDADALRTELGRPLSPELEAALEGAGGMSPAPPIPPLPGRTPPPDLDAPEGYAPDPTAGRPGSTGSTAPPPPDDGITYTPAPEPAGPDLMTMGVQPDGSLVTPQGNVVRNHGHRGGNGEEYITRKGHTPESVDAIIDDPTYSYLSIVKDTSTGGKDDVMILGGRRGDWIAVNHGTREVIAVNDKFNPRDEPPDERED